jgi:hypothetical protein
VPKSIVVDSDRPRGRGKSAGKTSGKGAIAIDAAEERGLLMRALLYSPKDLLAGLIAFAAVSAIIANAIFMQAGRHPSPMFGSTVVMPLVAQPVVNPLPRPRPIDADARPSERTLDSRLFENRPAEIKPAADAPKQASIQRAPAAAPAATRGDPVGDLINSTRRISAVQRALTEFGYGQLKTTGNIGPETQAAIQKFERERKLPVTGQLSERLVRELAAVTGRPIE